MMESNFNIPLPDDVDLFREFTPSPSSFEPDVGGSNPDSFPTVLHGIVSDESSDDCIHWLPSGTHFAITDKEKVSFQRHYKLISLASVLTCILFEIHISFLRRSYPFILGVEEQPSSLVSPGV